jgi:hypothetical protein
MTDLDEMYSMEITDEEEAAGFAVGTVKNPKGHYSSPFGPAPAKDVYAAVRKLDGGLRVVKTLDPSGKNWYSVRDQQDKPVDGPFDTLAGLLEKYP